MGQVSFKKGGAPIVCSSDRRLKAKYETSFPYVIKKTHFIEGYRL